jgi:hypothetical protein
MATYYVIDSRSNRIVNAITTTRNLSDPTEAADALRGFINPEHLRLDANPPQSMLERYQYWSERP